MAISDLLTQVNNVKLAIKNALINKEVDMTNVPFTEYASKINSINVGTIEYGIINYSGSGNISITTKKKPKVVTLFHDLNSISYPTGIVYNEYFSTTEVIFVRKYSNTFLLSKKFTISDTGFSWTGGNFDAGTIYWTASY